MSRYRVVKVREPKPFAVLDARHSRFVVDQNGDLLLSATAQDAERLASQIFNGVGVTR